MRPLPALVSLALVVGAAGCGDSVDDLLSPRPTGCYIGHAEEPLNLSAEQTFNAATIAAVGLRDGMDEHAVTVAIATAFQESTLSNVDYGDHDSLGLFQQRPSAGWGTEEEILDPVYASFKFYEKLRRTDGWREMEIGDAAQAVQISAYPDLYAQWVDEATVAAAAFAGGEEAGVSCIAPEHRETSTDAAALAEAYAYQWGAEVSGVDGQTVTINADDEAAGWNRASWAVAKSYEFAIVSIDYAGMRWQPGEDGWVVPEGEVAEAAAADASTVRVVLAEPA
ncbi:hypothetical protein [Glycomyces tarimensis]